MRENLAVLQFGIFQWLKRIDDSARLMHLIEKRACHRTHSELPLITPKLKSELPIRLDMATLSKGTNTMEPAIRIERNNLSSVRH